MALCIYNMAIRLPRRETKSMPIFNRSDLKALHQYFKDIEMIIADANLRDANKIRYIKYYISTKVAEL